MRRISLSVLAMFCVGLALSGCRSRRCCANQVIVHQLTTSWQSADPCAIPPPARNPRLVPSDGSPVPMAAPSEWNGGIIKVSFDTLGTKDDFGPELASAAPMKSIDLPSMLRDRAKEFLVFLTSDGRQQRAAFVRIIRDQSGAVTAAALYESANDRNEFARLTRDENPALAPFAALVGEATSATVEYDAASRPIKFNLFRD